MNKLSLFIFLAILLLSSEAISGDRNLCGALKGFAKSVGVDASKSIEFQTSWGSGFKKEKEPGAKIEEKEMVVYEKRCNFHEYEPAKKVCDILMHSSSIEFPYLNLKRVMACLSPKTKFAKDMEIENMSVSFYFGSEDRGAVIYVNLGHEPSIGGDQLKIEVEGY